MTIYEMSNTYYNIYKFSANQAKKVSAIEPFKKSRNNINIEAITNPLKAVNIFSNTKNNHIVSLDSFIKKASTPIQSSSYNSPNNIKNKLSSTPNVSINKEFSMAYIMDKLNINNNFTNISNALNITSASQFINMKNITSSNRVVSNKNVNNYTYYLNTIVNGSFFNGVG